MLGGPFRFGICKFRYSVKLASSRLYWDSRALPFRRWDSASTASSSGFWVQVFFPAPLDFPGRGVLSSSSRMTRSGVGSHLQFLAFGSSALLDRGSSSDGLAGGGFTRTFSRRLEPEPETSLGGCETRLAGAHFRRLAIESSWSPKESAGPVDFFWCFSSSLRASTSSFPLASSFQNNPAACLANWCGSQIGFPVIQSGYAIPINVEIPGLHGPGVIS